MLNKALGYAGSTARHVTNAWNNGAGRIGMTGMAAATGAGVGGLYGATFGRDPGQSRFGGFVGGAMGGAAMGVAGRGAARYGSAAYRGGNRTLGAYKRLGTGSGGPSNFQRAEAFSIGAGRGAWRQLKRDAMAAKRFIGSQNGLRSNIGNSWSALKAGYNG